MTTQDQLPWDPEYAAACEAVITTKHALNAAMTAWYQAVARRNQYLTADGVLPQEPT
jgi:hypothetical protein